jgi:hypothetical protein
MPGYIAYGRSLQCLRVAVAAATAAAEAAVEAEAVVLLRE